MSAAPICIARRLLAAGAAAGLAGCLAPFPTQPVALDSPELRPEVFFAGRTQGIGTLTRLIGGQETLRVEGRGRTGLDGVFRLDQVVRYADGRVEERTWHLRRTGPGAYAASLSDAAGPVSLEVTGNRAEIRYLLRQPAVRVHQSLYLRPDGRSVLNQATITVLGIPWARLSEEITRLAAGARNVYCVPRSRSAHGHAAALPPAVCGHLDVPHHLAAADYRFQPVPDHFRGGLAANRTRGLPPAHPVLGPPVHSQNFGIGVASGVPLQFQIGTNWAPYSYISGDFVGNILGYEAAMAFMLEAGFLGIMVFGWNRVSPPGHRYRAVGCFG